MTARLACYDAAADIAWMRSGDPDRIVSQETGWGLLDRDADTYEVVGMEIREASRLLPFEILIHLPAPGTSGRD